MIITDPVLATQVLRNKAVDKLRFMYSFLDVVRATAALLCVIASLACQADVFAAAHVPDALLT